MARLTPKKRVLITGGSGDLGQVLSRQAVAAGHDVISTYLARKERIVAGQPLQLDLCEKDAVKKALDETTPDVIIHTALALGVPQPRQQIVAAAYHLSKLTPKDVRLIFLSTDMVFAGINAPYKDTDPPSPVTPYGQAKAEMEMMADHVVRTSLIYDFIAGNKQVDWMLEKITRGEKCRLFTDELRSPIWVRNLADVLIELMDSIFAGVLNVAGPKPMSRYDLGVGLLKVLGYEPARYAEAVTQAGSGRQPNLTLDVSKAKLLLKTPLLTFEEALAQWRSQRTIPSAPPAKSTPKS
ncbi:MAG: sugar nucleotide-binding protein [Anaerolineae bacterium]|nr:sugar nucleotide-binding protein [Anaerolineae bacterium]